LADIFCHIPLSRPVNPGRSRRRPGADPSVTGLEAGGRPARLASDRRLDTKSPSLADQIAGLELQLAALKRQQADADDARRLRAIAIGTRGCVFTVRALVDLAGLDADVRVALGGLRPKQLGKWLARVADRNIQGLRVERVKLAETGAWVWDLHFHEDPRDRA